MTRDERSFFNDVKNAVSNYGCSFSHYHENGQFCVDVEVDDMDEWALCDDEIWDALNDVVHYWDGGIDQNANVYYLGINLD